MRCIIYVVCSPPLLLSILKVIEKYNKAVFIIIGTGVVWSAFNEPWRVFGTSLKCSTESVLVNLWAKVGTETFSKSKE